MVAKKGSRGGTAGDDAGEELSRDPLQAILLADSFATLFRPITLERSKVLLPLVNAPMIEYTLVWLESAGVEEVFVFCCAHSKQVIEYLEKSNWLNQPNFSVSTIESYNAMSAGDALRLIYEKNVVHGDFVLVTGDTVSNMPLTQALKEHKERKKRDSNAVMTMVIKQSKPSPITHQSRLGTEELFMAIDPETKELLYYEDKADTSKGTLTLDRTMLLDRSSISFHNDKQDCYIDICSPEVLSLFTDNFDYQHLRRHFVKGLLVDDLMGYKIFTHEIHSSYAARVENYRSYDTISKDIIQRWTYPLVPDIQFLQNSLTKLERRGTYRASDVGLSRSAKMGPFTVIGSRTTIGKHSEVSNSVIGEDCVIGSNVSIDGCYIWNKVNIEDGCRLKHAIVCDGVTMKSGAVLEAGVVLSFKVIIGQNFVVPAYSKVSLLQQPVRQDSDEELEYADNSSGNIEITSVPNTTDVLEEELRTEVSDLQIQAASEVGGAGFIWSFGEKGLEEEWRHSVAPISADRLLEIIKSATDELDTSNEESNILPPSGELGLDSGNESDDGRDDHAHFEREVEATFLRAIHENVEEDHIIIEVNSLRLSYNMASTDCAGALFYAMMKYAVDTPHDSAGELLKITNGVIGKWEKLLKYYLPSLDEEIEVILKFEEMCLESTKEYANLFSQILHLLYDKDILQEDGILRWESEKEQADESDKVFVKKAEKFLQWLKDASEEED
ncbi:translation initiation factor eIF-2B subunit epsilon-like isoform X1 [Salvia splendens]|uniref:translation initiation factor eIF-2B subunit epsilon-like isoform X1 n=1 Tax=Salvia splendens TaxID=180675 RepID=UPI001C265A3A|nr:translation initiation factor eIF-2B subunit epsilon-like isoform X1 [Salvia splendens]